MWKPKIRPGTGFDDIKYYLPEGVGNSFSGGRPDEIQPVRRAIWRPCSTLEPPETGRRLRFLGSATTVLQAAACQSPHAETFPRRRCFPTPSPARDVLPPENRGCRRNGFRWARRVGLRAPAFETLRRKTEWKAGIAAASNERRSSNASPARACAGCHRQSRAGLCLAGPLSSYFSPGRWQLERIAGRAKISASERRT